MKSRIGKNSVRETLFTPQPGRPARSGRFPQLFSDPEAKRLCDSAVKRKIVRIRFCS